MCIGGMMLRAVVVFWCVLMAGCACRGDEVDERFPYRLLLVPDGRGSDRAAELHWAVDFEEETVDFRLSVPLTNGRGLRESGEWIAFGMSPDGTLANADVVVFWFPNNGKLRLTEAYTDSGGAMHEDGSDHDYLLLGWRLTPPGFEEDSPARMEVEFRRRFDTCDLRDYRIESGTVDMFYLRGNHPTIVSGRIDPRRAELAFQRAQLLKSTRRSPPLPPDVRTVEILASETHVPSKATTYWCMIQKFPDLEEKHHIIQFEPVISPGSESVVHHIEVFNCILPRGVKVPDYNGECEDEDQPPELAPCKRVIGAWAMGAQAFSYPEEAGVPIGGAGLSPYVMLQVHYNNPDHKKGIIDSSGLRFHLTTLLRPNNAGILEVGATYSPNLSVPPASNGFYLTGYCAPECTNQGIPNEGIRVFASQLHTHMTGKAIWTKHVRNGVELQELNRDDHYNAMFQEIRLLQNEVTVLPGDALITTCRYDTSSRPNVTLGGFGIQDEMCVNYMHYYPSSGLEVCKSTVATTALDAFFGFVGDRMKGTPLDVTMSSPSAVAHHFLNLKWSPSVKLLWQYVINQAPIDEECLQSSGQPFHGEWKSTLPPAIKFPRASKRRRCLINKQYPFLATLPW